LTSSSAEKYCHWRLDESFTLQELLEEKMTREIRDLMQKQCKEDPLNQSRG
jgi:hypothetical protein